MATYDPPGGVSLLPAFQPSAPAPAVAPAPAAGGYQIPAGLATYPGLLEQIQRLNTSGGTNQSLLSALRQRLLIQFGRIPDNLNSALTGNANADVTQLTRDLAQQSTQGGVSTVAGLQRQYDQARNQGISTLAEHGLARSGGVGQTINQTLGDYQRSLYGAQQSLEDQLAQGYQTFLGQQDTLSNQYAQAIKDANTGQAAAIANGSLVLPAGGAGSSGGSAAPSTGGGQQQTLNSPAAPSAPNNLTPNVNPENYKFYGDWGVKTLPNGGLSYVQKYGSAEHPNQNNVYGTFPLHGDLRGVDKSGYAGPGGGVNPPNWVLGGQTKPTSDKLIQEPWLKPQTPKVAAPTLGLARAARFG